MKKNETISIFDIKRFAVHDGPGIRTTLFFKGCSLFCPWCQNPEGISKTKNLLFQKSKCIECHTCVAVCPQNTIQTSADTKLRIDRVKCDLCGECVKSCPTEALHFDSKEMTIDEIVSELLKDEVFFSESGGGVTFSGGEPLLQIEAIAEISKRLKKHEIHIVVETSLMVPHKNLVKAATFVDLFIVDIKLLDPAKAKDAIGLDLELYRRNVEFLFANQTEFICRMPLIPGYTNTSGNFKAITKIINKFNKKYNRNISVEPINFNPLSKSKYIQLGKELPKVEQWKKFTNEELKTYHQNLNHEN